MGHVNPRVASSEFYEWFAPIYDDVYDAIDVEEAVRQWRLLVRKIAGLPRPQRRRSKLLDLGCGTGRYLPEWSSAGFAVTGVDASAAMVSRARRRVGGLARSTRPVVIRGDVRKDLPALRARGPFDLVVAHFNFLNLFTLADVGAILKSLRPVMAAEGWLFADCGGPASVSERNHEEIELDTAMPLRITTAGVSQNGTVRRIYRRRGTTRTETYHLHSVQSLRRAARSSGWRAQRAVEWRPERRREPWSFSAVGRSRQRVLVFRLAEALE